MKMIARPRHHTATLMAVAVAIAMLLVCAQARRKQVVEDQLWYKKELRDEEYNEWAGRTGSVEDAESVKRGRIVGCSFCHMMVPLVQSLTQNRQPEDQMGYLLLSTCENLPSSKKMRDEDARMVCRRIVREHGGAMVDGVSTGETADEICAGEGLCDMSSEHIQRSFEMYDEYLKWERTQKDEANKGNHEDAF